MAGRMDLQLLGQKTLAQPANPDLLSYCPSMDLVALANEEEVLIFQLNGERVHVVAQRRSSARIQRLTWKPNGQLLAIAWDDNTVRLIDTESNKVVHQMPTGESTVCLGWASNSTLRRTNRAKSSRDGKDWQSLVNEQSFDEGNSLDLPRDLALIDVESSIPKLSVLPVGGTSEDIFSSRASLDGIFRPFDPKDNEVVDIMVVGTSDGQLHLSIYDSFVIGSFTLPLAPYESDQTKGQLWLHAASKTCSTHSLLMRSDKQLTYLIPMDLRFIASSSSYLSLLASKSTSLQNLLRYIHQVQILMTAEWISTRDLPGKFLRNINETLAEKKELNIVQAMYHSVVTGHTIPTMKEWLVDELAERGHKRWDKAVATGLDNLRRTVHENMLPALERCNVILSRLLGIAKYQGSNNALGFSSQQISLIMDTVACLNLVSAKILTLVVDEIDSFAAFSSWMRHEIDKLASNSLSASADDQIEKESAIDHSKVLLYIQGSLMESRLSVFFEEDAPENSKNEGNSKDGLPMFHQLSQQLKNHNKKTGSSTSFLRLNFLFETLERQTNGVFQGIAEAERRNVMFGEPVALGFSPGCSRMSMIVCPEDETRSSIYVAAITADNTVQIFCVVLQVVNGISALVSTTTTSFGLGEGKIKDIAFLDTRSLLVLWLSTQNEPSVLRVEFRGSSSILSYKSGSFSGSASLLQAFETLSLPPDAKFIPERLEVRSGDSTHKISVSPRICVLGNSQTRYKVFGLSEAKTAKTSANEDIEMGGSQHVA